MANQTDRQRARREGWEAGREEAATVLRQEGYSAAASRIRALKPKE